MDFPSAEQGKRVRALRKKTHLSRRAFAAKHGIPKGSLQNWEDGRYQCLSKAAIDVLITAFTAENIPCTADYLLHGTEIPSGMQASENLNPYSSLRVYSNLVEQTREFAKLRQLDEQLLLAVTSGRNEAVAKLLNQNLSFIQDIKELRLYGEEENSLLHEAAKSGHLNVVKILIDQGCQADSKNKLAETPLHLAVRHGYEEIAHYLILNGATLSLNDKEGDTALAWACKYGQTAIARQLIKLGAEVNTKNQKKYSPLHWAAMGGFDDLIELLLQHGAKSTEKNVLGKTPLMCAIQNGHVAAVELLENLPQ